MIAAKHDWSEIKEIIDEAKQDGHIVAALISKLKLETNHILLTLKLLLKFILIESKLIIKFQLSI